MAEQTSVKSPAYVYRINKKTGQWYFEPVNGIDMNGESFIEKPIETWTIKSGEKAVVFGFILSYSEIQKKFQNTVIDEKGNITIVPVTEPIIPLYSVIENEKYSICQVSRDVTKNEIKFICWNHSRGCEPRVSYSRLGQLREWSEIRNCMEEVAYVSVVAIEDAPDKHLFVETSQ